MYITHNDLVIIIFCILYLTCTFDINACNKIGISSFRKYWCNCSFRLSEFLYPAWEWL